MHQIRGVLRALQHALRKLVRTLVSRREAGPVQLGSRVYTSRFLHD